MAVCLKLRSFLLSFNLFVEVDLVNKDAKKNDLNFVFWALALCFFEFVQVRVVNDQHLLQHRALSAISVLHIHPRNPYIA